MSDTDSPSSSGRCLSEEQLEAVRSAPPGGTPESLALHLAGCVRCQERALFGPGPRPRRRGGDTPQMPTSTRAFFMLALMVAVMVAFFYTLHMLVGKH